MNKLKFFWKVWLRPNLLTKDVENDYIAEVSTARITRRNEDIAARIVYEGSEIAYETLLNILNRADRVARRMLQQGESVQNGNVRISPRVKGTWIGANARFDSDNHRLGFDAVITHTLRQSLGDITIEILGVKERGAFIGLVTDTFTGRADAHITPGEDILIEGDRIKIIPEDDAHMGIYFQCPDIGLFKVERRLTKNLPKTVIARVPDLPDGKYTLRLETFFTKGQSRLKNPRSIVYGRKLIVGDIKEEEEWNDLPEEI